MGQHARILIVDDDESIRKVLATILEEKGYTVETAETGEEAIKKCETESYNVALIDIRLPDIDGIKLLTMIGDATPRMVKIIVTGYPSLQNAMEAVNKNADAYILKPVNIESILKVIEEQLKKQQENNTYNEKKVAVFIETRIREAERQQTTMQLKKKSDRANSFVT